jgi:prepilin-type N-terminal cleavage/methylation domain-containing protein
MKGFTLIEIMISLVILGTSLVVLLGLRNRDIAISSHANHIILATLCARERIALFSLQEDKTSVEKKGNCEQPHPDYKWEVRLAETGFPKIQELSMNVIWNEQDRKEEVMITTYINTERP